MSATQVDNLAGMTGQANKQLTEKMKKLESENKTLKKGLQNKLRFNLATFTLNLSELQITAIIVKYH